MVSEEIDEIWALYADDGGQSLDGVEEALLALQANARDNEAICALFRAMHTFKGNSRLLGLTAIESCAHLAEDLISLVRDEGVEIDSEFLALLLEATDTLRSMMEATLSTRRDADAEFASSISSRMRAKFERNKTGSAEAVSEPRHSSAENLAAADAFEFSESAEAVVFEPIDVCLAHDPLYREIFLEMARDCLAALSRAHEAFNSSDETSKAAVAEIALRLQLAAEQIGIAEWPEASSHLADAVHHASTVEAAIARLNALYERDIATLKGDPARDCPPPADAFVELVDRLEPLINGLLESAEALQQGHAQSSDHIQSITRPIREAAELLGYIGLADTATLFPVKASDKAGFYELLIELYRDLKLIEELASEAENGPLGDQRASIAALGDWCASQGAAIVDRLHGLIANPQGQADTTVVERLLQHINIIFRHNGPETAGRIAMTLADLISRIAPTDFSGHPIIRKIETFIALIAPIFTSNRATGAAPDMAAMEGLLQDLTAEYSSVENVQKLETRLGLPAHLQGCLTSSSVDAANTALQQGKRFYIIRADLSADEDMAQRFIAWIEASAAATISSVTVFEGNRTVFDFLIASPFDQHALIEAIRSIDPKGLILRLEMSLPIKSDSVSGPAPPDDQPAYLSEFTPTSLEASEAMLESIGELITGHSAMRQIVSDLEEDNLLVLIDAELRNHGGNWNKARVSVRSLLDRRQERAAELVQIQAQMAALLGQVQAEALASRCRPASSFLNSLAAFGETRARAFGRSVSIKTSGGGEAVDLGLLRAIEEPLRQLVSVCLETVNSTGGKSADRLTISLVQNEDHVCVTLESQSAETASIAAGTAGEEAQNLHGWIDRVASTETTASMAIRRVLRLKGGDLRSLKTTSGAPAFRVTMPLATAVLEGMVVRVGDVRYVVPIHSIQRIVHSDSNDLIRVSASNGRLMLKLSQNDVLPVSHLAENGIGGLPPADLLLTATAQNDNPLKDVGKQLFVVAGNRTRRVALAIDELIGQQTVLLRPLKGYLSAIRDVTGCALLGSGGVGMVLDMRAILERE